MSSPLTPQNTTAFVVRLVAKPGREDALAALLTGARALADAETTTPVWYALRAAPAVFYIVDAFPDAAARQRHLEGEIAAALRARAGELLAEPPSIEPAEVLVEKLPRA